MDIGKTFTRGGFPYQIVGIRDHETLDGRWIELFEVRGRCADCGRAFVFSITKGRLRRKNQPRRCERHKNMGTPAKPPKRRKSRPTKPRRETPRPMKGDIYA